MRTTRLCLGVDVGGTKIAAGLVDEEGTLIRTSRIATPQRQSAAHVVARIVAVARYVQATEPLVGVGVGVPGVVEPVRGVLVTAADTMGFGWGDAAVAEPIAAALGTRVTVDNDANAFAVGELRFGAGRGTTDGLYVSVGTGIGAGLVVDGRLVRGFHGGAGEIGHLAVPGAEGAPCSCGLTGHLEAVAGGRAIERRYAAQAGIPVGLRLIAQRARAGEETAVAVLARAGTILGEALAGLANVLDPQVVVVGGGVMGAGGVHWTAVRDAFAGARLPGIRDAALRRATLGPSAGVVGAAALVVPGPSAHR